VLTEYLQTIALDLEVVYWGYHYGQPQTPDISLQNKRENRNFRTAKNKVRNLCFFKSLQNLFAVVSTHFRWVL